MHRLMLLPNNGQFHLTRMVCDLQSKTASHFSSLNFCLAVKVLPHELNEGSWVADQIAEFRWRFQRFTQRSINHWGSKLSLPSRRQVWDVGKWWDPWRPAQALNLCPKPMNFRQQHQYRKWLWCPFRNRVSYCIVIHKKQNSSMSAELLVVLKENNHWQQL